MELISHFYPSLAICLFLAYTIRCNPNFARPDSRYFMLALHLVIVLIGADVAELLLSTLPYFTQWRVFFSVVGYALRPAALYCLVFILRPCLSRKAAVWLSLPLACHVLLLLTAFSRRGCSDIRQIISFFAVRWAFSPLVSAFFIWSSCFIFRWIFPQEGEDSAFRRPWRCASILLLLRR